MYLTYEKYIELGGVLEVTAFDRQSTRAFARIRHETKGRIDNMSVIPIEVENACRDLIEFMHYNKPNTKAVASESQSQGGASESKSYVAKSEADYEREIEGIIYDYLIGLVDDKGYSVLYRG
jgi:hypothetical protein